MKTTDSRDPLDRKIDALLASRPLQPGADFSARVLAAVDTPPAQAKPGPIAKLLHFALPLAAVAAFAFTFAHLLRTQSGTSQAPSLTAADMQEIFLLQEGLSAFTQLQYDNLNGDDLLSTLDALDFDIQS
jgi:hypothetical protein